VSRTLGRIAGKQGLNTGTHAVRMIAGILRGTIESANPKLVHPARLCYRANELFKLLLSRLVILCAPDSLTNLFGLLSGDDTSGKRLGYALVKQHAYLVKW